MNSNYNTNYTKEQIEAILNTIEKCDLIYEVKNEKIVPTSLEGRTIIH